MLMRVSEYYEKETHNQLRQLVSLVEPLLIVVMGLVVGFVVVAMLLGIFSMNDLPF
jgi:general secretion pathway protein F